MKPPELPPFDLPARPRILVITLRRLGDVLFTTPLLAAIRHAWPQATIHALVFENTAGILAGNPDLDGILTMRRRGFSALGLMLRIARRYDLAVSTQSGDRPTAFALVAGQRHVGPIDAGRRGALRRLVLSRSVASPRGLHRLEQTLRIADALGVARITHLVPPRGDEPPPIGRGPHAVIHAAPMFAYKRWTGDGWRALAAGLRARGLRIVATGSRAAEERAYLDEVWRDMPDIIRLDGHLTWPQVAALLASAQIYVGPDTSVTHVAAATGCPTVALFGPTDPRLWGPVPAAGLAPMWESAGTIQRRANVWLVQNPLPCLPCHDEGCERHLLSHSRCLDELSPAQVLRAADAALAATDRAHAQMTAGSAADQR